MSDSSPTPIVVQDPPSTKELLKFLPKGITIENLDQAFQYVNCTCERFIRGAFRIGSYILDDKPDLTSMVIQYGYSDAQLKSWKGFAKLCRSKRLEENQLFAYGSTLSGISKALKPAKEPQEKKPKIDLDKLQQDLQDAQATIKELQLKLQDPKEPEEEPDDLKKTKKKFIDYIKTTTTSLEAKDAEIAELKLALAKVAKPKPTEDTGFEFLDDDLTKK